jgi:predicted metal-binding membrane protein
MTDSPLEAVLRRDRWIVGGAIVLIVALAWSYVLWLANDMDMGGMDMTEFRMIPAGVGIMLPADEPWRTIEFAYVFLMWAVMMVGMMAPSTAPMILMYARVGRQGKAQASHSPRPAGLPPVIFSPGAAFRWRPPCSNGRSSGPPCWIPGWRSRATCSAASS